MMNYVGSVSILDRGDAPARAIIDKNARSLAQRIADETKDELDKVMNRVENIYVSYEQSTQDMFATSSANVEYLEDLKELEAILTDQIKKKKYQQQVTVFIVGFENMSSQRLRLIQQVNEFFMDATRPQEEDEPFPPSPDIDMEEVAVSIEESLDTAEKLADRLGELNTQMCDWLTNYAINKASTKGKKKLEKALSQAKDDINSLSEKLLKVQGEMEEKDEKVGQLVKQLEAKGQDVQKFRTAAEIAKKSIQDLETANHRAVEDIKLRDQAIKDLKNKVSMLELDVGQSEYMTKVSSDRQAESKAELQRRLEELQNQVENQKSVMTDAQRDWQKQHDQRVLALTNSHKEEMAELQAAFEEELKKSKDEIEFTRVQLQEAEKNAQLAADEADKIRQNLLELQLRGSSSESKRPVEESEDELQESRPSTKSSKQSSATKQKAPPPAKSPVKSASVTVQQKSPTKPQKDVSESAVQDEGGDHLSAHVETRQSKRSRSTLEPVQEMEVMTEFDNQFDLKDDQSWSSVPPDQLAGRFNQYRKLSQKRVDELEEQLNIVMAKTQRKVQTLKAQFQEHKSKWESERKVLIEQVEQAQKLQTEAEKEADNAMSQLEEFINEQERLEEEEEEKRNDISKGIVSRPLTRRSSPEKGKTSPIEKDKTPPAQETSHTPEPEPALPTEGSEQELKRLMQQTDDAKAQEMARISSGAMSAPPAVEPENQKAESKEIRKLSASGGVRSPRPLGKSVKTQPSKGINDTDEAIEEVSEIGSGSKSKSRESDISQRGAWLTPRTTPLRHSADIDGQSPEPPLPASQESAVTNVKSMLEERNLSGMQHRTLDSLRSAIQKVNEETNLSDLQLERTLTIISLASQLTEESLHLGILPDTLFDQFADINSRAMSEMSHGDDQFELDDSSLSLPPLEFLRPFTRESTFAKEPATVMTFLQELSQSSLKSLPPLHGYLTSSQSQRNISRQRSGFSARGKMNFSAPVTKPYHDLDHERSFATMATRGSTGDLPLSKHSSRMMSEKRRLDMMSSLRGMPGGEDTELDIILMDTETQTDPEITGEQSLTEDDVRLMSSHSRASLRSQYRNKLEETRAAIEDRRAKSPAISVPSQRSLEEDQLIEEEDDFTMADLKEETVDVGTSPPPTIPRGQSTSMSRRSAALADHPVVNEYLRAYDGVMNFKEGLSKILIDREMLQAGEIVHDLSICQFDRETKVKPQLEKMTANVYEVLEEITHVLASIMQADREPIVSSLNGVVSRDGTKTTLHGRERSADSGRGQTMTRASNQSLSTRLLGSEVEEKQAMRELQLQYERLEHQLNEETRKHEEQLRHNTVVMMEMQDTINELQRELSTLGRSSSRMRPASEASQQPPESAIMFTRLDSDRNSKIMKRAVNDDKLDVDRYKDAVNKMDSYVSLPAQRLGHLVRKYVHHCRMKEIEENVKKSRSLNENVFEILDKMEALQNQRAKRWADKMDEMGSERLRLASILMETLDSIEQESGIFLIKPMYSYRGRDMKERYASKLTRPARHRNVSPLREISSYAPAPTPASNIRGLVRSQAFIQAPEAQKQYIKMEPVRPLEGDDTGLMGSQALAYNGVTQRQTWNLSSSQVRGESTDFHSNLMNTPRILELDINRMLIGQNNISNKMALPGYSDDRLVNAAQNNLRSYVTVNRPTVQPSTVQQRPRSYSGIKDVPPTSPVTRSATTTSAGGSKRVRMSESAELTRPSIPCTPPLPPISARDSDNADQGDDEEPPRSPPGSSLRQSPPHVQEIVSPIK